jgi:hypothetical protein
MNEKGLMDSRRNTIRTLHRRLAIAFAANPLWNMVRNIARSLGLQALTNSLTFSRSNSCVKCSASIFPLLSFGSGTS